MDELERAVRERIRESGADVVVAVVAAPVDAAPLVSIDPDRSFHAASTMKVPVLVELYRRVELGALRLDEPLLVRNRFRSIGDGRDYELDPADDSERGLYEREGEHVAIGELARLAIVVSSNLATNLLVDLLGAGAITATMRELGAPSLVVRRGVEDAAAWERGINNEVTARGLATVLDGIARGAVVSPGASAAMRAILEDQEFNEGIPAGLPAGARVAHKTGSISRLYHDAAIVFPLRADPWILVVLTTGFDEVRAAPALVASISGIVGAALDGLTA